MSIVKIISVIYYPQNIIYSDKLYSIIGNLYKNIKNNIIIKQQQNIFMKNEGGLLATQLVKWIIFIQRSDFS